MAATKIEISTWFDDGLKSKDSPTHMLVVCDTYDYDDYPVYVKPSENVQDIYNKYNGQNMQRVMEVYNLKIDKNTQLSAVRVMNF